MSNVSHASLIITVLSCVLIALLVACAQCFVCGTEAVVTFKPCGHAVICAGCAERVKKCPTCKVLYMDACMLPHIYMYMYTSHYSTLETSQEFCILMLNVRRSSHTTSSQPLRPPFLFRYLTTVVHEHFAYFN